MSENWHSQAACYGVIRQRGNSDLFFGGTKAEQEGAQYCAVCTVRLQCLDYAVTHNTQHGTWGGESTKRRRQIRRELLQVVQSIPEQAVTEAATRLAEIWEKSVAPSVENTSPNQQQEVVLDLF